MSTAKTALLLAELTKGMRKPRELVLIMNMSEVSIRNYMYALAEVGILRAVQSETYGAGRPGTAYGISGWDYSTKPPMPPSDDAADKAFIGVCNKIPGWEIP